MNRNYTSELLKAQREGRQIVCSVGPYDGRPVVYRPAGGNKPWVLADSILNSGYRYSGRECHVKAED